MDKISEAKIILNDLGMPKSQQNDISALTLLSLCSIKKNSKWSAATRTSQTVTKSIMSFINKYYRKYYAPNTRETFRRQVLHQFVQGGVADYNPDNPGLPVNSPNAHYAITQDALKVVKNYNTSNYGKSLTDFIRKHGSLAKKYDKQRKRIKYVPVVLPDGLKYRLSPGKHNQIQVAVIQKFIPRFITKPMLLYFGDTAKKDLFLNTKTFKRMKIDISGHGKLPDIIVLDQKRKWLFLIEVVTSHGPMNPKRIYELKEVFSTYKHGVVFVSAFPDFNEFKRHSNNISWETEVWLADSPDHMIHYNGDRFLGPR